MGAAARGAQVVLTCRDEARGKIALAEVAGVATGPAPELLQLDLASLVSVRRAASEALGRFTRIDVLVNNAGVFSRSWAASPEGFELSMATNHLGPFLFTNLLMPAFAKGSRIVNLSSAVWTVGNADLERPAKGGIWSGFMNYAASKRMVILATLGLADRGRALGISANALHPGVVRTEIMRMRTWYGFIVDLILLPFFAPAFAGVEAALGLALSPELEGVTGGYFDRAKRQVIPVQFLDKELVDRYWNRSASLVGLADAQPDNGGKAR